MCVMDILNILRTGMNMSISRIHDYTRRATLHLKMTYQLKTALILKDWINTNNEGN